MASNKLPSCLGILFTLFFFSLALAAPPPSAPVGTSTACNATLDPNFCKSVLPAGQPKQNLYDYSRVSLAKSLSSARKFLQNIKKCLAPKRAATLSTTAIQSLLDCHLLSQINIDILVAASTTLNSTNVLLDNQTETFHTSLSALLTNQQTCSDGIQATAASWSFKGGLAVPLSNGTKFYSMSLALFSNAYVDKKKKKSASYADFHPGKQPPPGYIQRSKRLLLHEVDLSSSGGLPLRMSDRDRPIFESRSGRRLQQASDQVVVSGFVFVNANGTGDFTNITSAVNSAPNNADGTTGYYLIYVTTGVYQEYVSIPKNKRYLMMIGDGINKTVITGNHSVVNGQTTFSSATLAVVGEGFAAMSMTIANTAGEVNHQAVALRNGADLSTFYSCSFDGYQDTLYAHSMRQFYRECDIYGTVDFIFGNAAAVFQDCNMYARPRPPGQVNVVTAQGRTDPNQNTGMSLQGCRILPSGDMAASGTTTTTYLGRPWKPYSRTVIMQSFLDSLISPAGWLPWNGEVGLSTLYYAEYSNTGPGADTSQRVQWPGIHYINSTEASNFTTSSFLLADNWLPRAGVPYLSGLA